MSSNGNDSIQLDMRCDCVERVNLPQQMTICDLGDVYDGLLMPPLAPRLKILEMRLVLVRMAL